MYKAGGGVLRAAGGSDARGAATEVEVGAAHVVAGEFPEATGPADDITSVPVQAVRTS